MGATSPAVTTPAPAATVAEPNSAKPKEVSQDVLDWLQMSPEKSAKADKADKADKVDKVDKGDRSDRADNKTDAQANARNAAASPAPASAPPPSAVNSANPSSAQAISLTRSPTLLPVSVQAGGPSPVVSAIPSSGSSTMATSAPTAATGAGNAGSRAAQADGPLPVIAAAAPTSAAPTVAPAKEALHLIAREQPPFPREAVRLGVSKGHVRVRLSIAVDGSVTHVEVLEASPHGAFDRAVVAATEHWKYAPVPEPTTAIAEFDFHRDE